MARSPDRAPGRFGLLPGRDHGLVRSQSSRLPLRLGAQRALVPDHSGGSMEQARRLHESSGKPARFFTEFAYRTLSSWSRERRVVAKAEYLERGESALCRDLSLHRGVARPKPLREALLCSWRHGESDQGTTPPLCRPALDRANGQQPTSPLLLGSCLHPGRSAATARSARNGLGRGPGRHPTAQAL
ncbi:protein of unknown function [Methylacidimicrobium sp. AP8]|nr:protein of unknown function [Methylacidimicrobium sp. AP8]